MTEVSFTWQDRPTTITVPSEYAERLRAVVRFCAWGPDFDRRISVSLADMRRMNRQGYADLALAELAYMEKIASAIAPMS